MTAVANPEHLEILNKGVEAWNEWRKAIGVDITPDLSKADLSHMNLQNVDFSATDLTHAYISDTDLSGAVLGDTIFLLTDIERVSLRDATIEGVDFTYTDLAEVDLTNATIGSLTFGRMDLRVFKGLETVHHGWPSTIGVDTLYRSGGEIPEAFLRGCGFRDWEIENAKLYQPELSSEEITNILYRVHDLRAHQAIQISPLFISYSHVDGPFVDLLEAYLNERGVRFWRDIHHSTAGRLERQIDRAIRLNPTVLLVLSEHSVKSDWVEHEARLARRMEQETGRDVLCPVALDDSWKTCR